MRDPDNPWGTVFDALDETGTINYSDTYFDEPSPGDHPKLRTNKVIWIYSSPPHE